MKCAIVTGGSRGIGRAICIKLAEEKNYHILINYTSNEAAAKETLAKVEELGATGEILKFDVGNAEETQKVLTEWQDAHPDDVVEVIVNNAGITRDGLFMWMPSEDWNAVINTSLNGFFNVTNFFIQKLLRNKYGRIINMVSVKRNSRPDELFCSKRRFSRSYKSSRTGSRKKKYYCKCSGSGFHQNRYDAGFQRR